ncbi:MAG: hypothetical protein ABGZ23_07565 [Fuerstiella sp.]
MHIKSGNLMLRVFLIAPPPRSPGWFSGFCTTLTFSMLAAVVQKPENHRDKPEWRGLKAERLKK